MSKSTPSNGAFGALLFDMDGTIISSVAAAERVWAAWAERQGLDVAAFLPTIHGVRGVEVIRQLELPGIDPQAEAHSILLAEMEDVGGIEAIEGAAAFLASLPRDRWAIVTSSPRNLALRRLEAAGLPPPAVFVTGEDVEHGKPAPDCFLLAAKRLGQKIEDCLVLRRRSGRHPSSRGRRRRGGRRHDYAQAPARHQPSYNRRLRRTHGRAPARVMRTYRLGAKNNREPRVRPCY